MNLTRILALVGLVALLTAHDGASQQIQQQPSITFGLAKVSLGMTMQQVEQRLSEAGRHMQLLSDKKTAIVSVSGNPGASEGQVTFSGDRAIYAQFQMPNVQSADELAQEIAGAVDGMASKTCTISNYSSHGTGGGFSQSVFACGSRKFNVMTVRSFGSNVPSINVNIEIGQILSAD